MKLLQQWLARKRSPLPPPQVFSFLITGKQVEITFKRHASARRFTLRAARDGKGFIMTVPKRASMEEAKRFALQSEGWIAGVLSRAKPKTQITESAVITVRGISFTITTANSLRGLVCADEDTKTITVPGRPEHLQRRFTDWLKTEAQRDFETSSRHYATAMGATYKRITIRDQKSRWGSCSSDGTLSYSWRLVLAPPMVLDYVAAHEVAHLTEMNHSPRFWRLVLKHCPHTRFAKEWLKKHGTELHRI